MTERWAKLYTRETTAWKLLGRWGQDLSLHIVRLKDENDSIDLCGADAVDVLCSHLPKWDRSEVRAGIDELTRLNCIQLTGESLVWCGLFQSSFRGEFHPENPPPIDREIDKIDKIDTPSGGDLIEGVLKAMTEALQELQPSKLGPRNCSTNRKLIRRPVKECGASLEDWQTVIRRQLNNVRKDPDAWRYLSLATLGRPKNFQRLLDQIEPEKTAPQRRAEWQDEDTTDRSEPVSGDRVAELVSGLTLGKTVQH